MGIITIRGQLGSGAPEIGKEVAAKLHYDYLDREIIAEVAARLHRQEQEVIAKEMPPRSFLGRIAKALEHSYDFGVGFEGACLPSWQMPLDDRRYLQALESVIKELAQNQSLVIYGRGSQFILKGLPTALHIFVVAPLKLREERLRQARHLDLERARQEIDHFDNSNREFIKRYFKADWEDPACYDLVINTEYLSFSAAAAIIIEALAHKK